MHTFLTIILAFLQLTPQLEKISEIGSSDDYFLSGIRNIELMGDTIVVSNGDQQQILLIDFEGNLLGSTGREGRGPGEFTRLGQIAVSPKSQSIYSWDQSLSRLSVFDEKGNFEKNLPLKDRYLRLTADHQGNVYLAPLHLFSSGNLVHKIRATDDSLETLLPPLPTSSKVHSTGNIGDITFSDYDRLLYYAPPYPYKIIGLDKDGKQVFDFEYDHPDFHPPEAGESSGGYQIAPELKSRISSLLVTEEALWVQYQTEDGHFLDVIDKASKTIEQTYALPKYHRLGFFREGHLYTYSVGRDVKPEIIEWAIP